MLKYVETAVVFRELPGEITLAINISNCPCHCEGCHSSYLAEDIGTVLNLKELNQLVMKNNGVTAVCFMGGDADPEMVNALAAFVKDIFDLKVGWYSGRQHLAPGINIKHFDYIKLGPYKPECGPLDNPCTNQVLYKVIHEEYGRGDYMENVTYLMRQKFV